VGDNHLSLNKYKKQSISVTFNKSLLRNSISPSERIGFKAQSISPSGLSKS
jgi:hypothetical protein